MTRVQVASVTALVMVGAWRHSSAPVHALTDVAVRPLAIDASTLVAALPAHLTPPLEPGMRLVAMVASDIDADGDLDLVANDGSLDLLVWINDGTGHLTRRYAHPSGGVSQNSSTATSDSGPVTASAVASGNVPLGPGPAVLLAPGRDDGSGLTYASPDLDALFARSQSPRAPPLSPFLL